MIARPHADEFVPFYAGYVQRIPENSDIIALMSSQPDELQSLLKNVMDAQANAHPAPQEWTIKEVLGHICDAERVFVPFVSIEAVILANPAFSGSSLFAPSKIKS